MYSIVYGEVHFLTFFVLLKNEKGPWAFILTLWSCSLKPSIKVLSHFPILFRLIKTFYHETRPNGVSFKLFLDSLNMKRLSNTCLLHTRKSIWRVISLMVGYLFFGSDRLSYEKGPFGFLFCLRLDSLNMNNTELTFIGLVKLNTVRPFFGNEPLLSRFVKHMRMDLSSDKLQRVYFTLFGLIKMKRGTHRSWWGN